MGSQGYLGKISICISLISKIRDECLYVVKTKKNDLHVQKTVQMKYTNKFQIHKHQPKGSPKKKCNTNPLVKCHVSSYIHNFFKFQRIGILRDIFQKTHTDVYTLHTGPFIF